MGEIDIKNVWGFAHTELKVWQGRRDMEINSYHMSEFRGRHRWREAQDRGHGPEAQAEQAEKQPAGGRNAACAFKHD